MFDSRSWRLLVLCLLTAVGFAGATPVARSVQGQAQPTNESVGPQADDAGRPASTGSSVTPDPPAKEVGIRVFELANEGGFFMYPIYALSILAVGVIIERSIALRSAKVLPPALVTALGKLGESKNGFEPKQAYRACQAHPSAAAAVIRSMLLKIGRPHSEVETTVQLATDREANRLYGNVRWLNLCATLAPLIGLLGTVQGMIIAFHRTTVMPVGANKSVELANGIYTALVTTFGGLCVAIPAAFAAHFFEGRIQTLFHEMDDLLFNLLPQIERYEGRVRFHKQLDEEASAETGIAPPPVPPRAAASTPK